MSGEKRWEIIYNQINGMNEPDVCEWARDESSMDGEIGPLAPKYDIRADRGDYWEARHQLRENVTALARKYDLHPSGDRIEDQGEHFYFVFTCGKSWR